jgi:hypothetical protein
MPTYQTQANQVLEIPLQTGKVYADPFNEVELNVVFKTPSGRTLRVPAFWAGGQEWRARFASPETGVFDYQVSSSDPADPAAGAQRGTVEVLPYNGSNPLLAHGAVKVQADRNGFEHRDGTPFFWLADTWWMSFCSRLRYPDEFETLLADRANRGFSLIHMVAGLFPDMPAFDPRGANEGGFAWEAGFERINPAFFDQADVKLRAVVNRGIVPLVVGAWGYYLPILGNEKMKKHWRYLAARWGAYPVIWCLCGEVTMPYYLSETKEKDSEAQFHGWSKVGRYLEVIDPFERAITAHSGEVSDPGFLDFSFIQTGHGNQSASLQSAKNFMDYRAKTDLLPVVNGEAHYEGIQGVAWEDVQRFIFWSTMLSGGAGFSYGANGIWQLNQPGKPYGPSPTGMSWGDIPWTEAMHYKGSTQVALGKKLLEKLPFWKFRAHPEWVQPHASLENSYQPYAAGVPGEVRVIYCPYPLASSLPEIPLVQGLEAGIRYRAYYFDPASGREIPIGQVEPDAQGNWRVPIPSLGQDIVLVMVKV